MEATVAQQVHAGASDGADADLSDDVERPEVSPAEQALAIANWIHAGSGTPRVARPAGRGRFPGLSWLRQPEAFSDREWILEIARQYQSLAKDTTDGPPEDGS